MKLAWAAFQTFEFLFDPLHGGRIVVSFRTDPCRTISLSLSLSLSVCISVCLSVSLSLCLSVSLSSTNGRSLQNFECASEYVEGFEAIYSQTPACGTSVASHVFQPDATDLTRYDNDTPL